MSATASFFIWYFDGLGGLGGWFIFFLIAIIAVIWLFYDSANRKITALGWRLGILLCASLLLPTLLWRFGGEDVRDSIDQFLEIIFYLGMLGGVLPPVIAVGYYVTYQGMIGDEHGHVYEAHLGECPECARREQAREPIVIQPPPVQLPYQPQPIQPSPVQKNPPPKPKAQAWLVTSGGYNYQLNQGETTIGRSSSNDIYITDDSTVGRRHAKIIEQNEHYRLFDLGSVNGTRVNDHLIKDVLLHHDDEIRFADNTVMRFKC